MDTTTIINLINQDLTDDYATSAGIQLNAVVRGPSDRGVANYPYLLAGWSLKATSADQSGVLMTSEIAKVKSAQVLEGSEITVRMTTGERLSKYLVKSNSLEKIEITGI